MQTNDVRVWRLLPLLGAGVLTALAALSAGCGRQATEAAPIATGPPAAPELATATPRRQALTLTVEQPGRVEAFEQTPVYAKIAGYVKDVRVEVGSRVKKGDPLAERDVPEPVEDLHHRQGVVTQAR